MRRLRRKRARDRRKQHLRILELRRSEVDPCGLHYMLITTRLTDRVVHTRLSEPAGQLRLRHQFGRAMLILRGQFSQFYRLLLCVL